MNKIEKLLDLLVKDASVQYDESELMFTLNKDTSREVQMILSRKNNDVFCFMDCYFRSNEMNAEHQFYHEKPFKFDMPMAHVHSFMQKYLKEDHFLLNYPKNITVLSANIYYNELLTKIDSDKKFSAIFLHAYLEDELPNNLEQAKKLKI